MSEWKPIETAPSGVDVLIFREGWPMAPVARWEVIDALDDQVIAMWVMDPDVFIPGSAADGHLGYAEDVEEGAMPTMWAPLPKVKDEAIDEKEPPR